MWRPYEQVEIYLERIRQMAKRKTRESADAGMPLRYKQITVEIMYTDGEIATATFYKVSDCFGYIERTVSERYANSVRIELF